MHVLHQDHLEFRQQPQQQRRVMASQGIAMIMQPVAGGIAPDPYLPGAMQAPPLLQESTVLTTTTTTTPFEDFPRDWRASLENEKNATWIEYLKSKIPLSSVPDFFLEPTTYAPFLYDAIWSLGLSMCEVGAEQDQLDGIAIMDKFKYLDFEGAS
jgi:hypothetical protein